MWRVQAPDLSPANYALQRGHTITLHRLLSSGVWWTEDYMYEGAKLQSRGVKQ